MRSFAFQEFCGRRFPCPGQWPFRDNSARRKTFLRHIRELPSFSSLKRHLEKLGRVCVSTRLSVEASASLMSQIDAGLWGESEAAEIKEMIAGHASFDDLEASSRYPTQDYFLLSRFLRGRCGKTCLRSSASGRMRGRRGMARGPLYLYCRRDFSRG